MLQGVQGAWRAGGGDGCRDQEAYRERVWDRVCTGSRVTSPVSVPCIEHVTPRVPVSGTLSFYCGVLGINCGKGLEKVLRWPKVYQKV